MNTTANETLAEHIERAIDGTNAATAIINFEEVCHAKTAHLRENWQDEASARVWEQLATYLERAEAFAVENRI